LLAVEEECALFAPFVGVGMVVVVGAVSGACSRIGGMEGWPLALGAGGELTATLGREGQEVAEEEGGAEEEEGAGTGVTARPENDLEERKEENVGEKGKPRGEEGEAE